MFLFIFSGPRDFNVENHLYRQLKNNLFANSFFKELFSAVTTQILIPFVIIMRNPSMKRYIINFLSSTMFFTFIFNLIKSFKKTCLVENRVAPEAFRRINPHLHAIV
jgi:hypothetical protein